MTQCIATVDVETAFLPRDAYTTHIDSAVYAMASCLSVTDRYSVEPRAGFRNRGFPRLILHCVIREFGYVQQ